MSSYPLDGYAACEVERKFKLVGAAGVLDYWNTNWGEYFSPAAEHVLITSTSRASNLASSRGKELVPCHQVQGRATLSVYWLVQKSMYHHRRL